MLKLSHLSKYYQVHSGTFNESKSIVKAVDGVSLTINQGENFALVGESGCGKTTLARMVMQLVSPTEGDIFLDDRLISEYSRKEYCHQIQMVFQDPYSSLDPRFTVKRILNEGLLFSKISRHQKDGLIVQSLDEVGLSVEVLNRYPHEFSGGERQRIAIARALVMKPKVLILDEAVSSLDVLVQKQIMDLFEWLQLKHKLTYIFISHNLRVVKHYCHRVAVMLDGKIVEQGTSQEIFDDPQHDYTKKLLKAALSYVAVD